MSSYQLTDSEKCHEECGVFGIYSEERRDVAKSVYYGLYALQHRGQESCGIAVNDTLSDEPKTATHRDVGLVGDVFTHKILDGMPGNMAVGHVRYSTTGSNSRDNVQPLSIRYVKGTLTIAHNGNISNARELRRQLEYTGAVWTSSSDTEVIAYLLARERIQCKSIEEAVLRVAGLLEGAFSLVIMSPQKLIAVRDPRGMRPLCIGKKNGDILFSSETCALDAIGAEFVRDVEPGEIVVAEHGKMHSLYQPAAKSTALCIFEYIYFARPDSTIDGQSVYQARLAAGRILAEEHPVDADMVIGVPDSGNIAAIGYAEQSDIPYGQGLIKNRYIGRTFILPDAKARTESVTIKLNAYADNVRGKRIIMVDDSIVRGTTITQIVTLLKRAGALEVHVRISAPEFLHACYYGTDISDPEKLVSNHYSCEALCEKLGADSLGFIPLNRIHEIAKDARLSFCDACFSGKYPCSVPHSAGKSDFETASHKH